MQQVWRIPWRSPSVQALFLRPSLVQILFKDLWRPAHAVRRR